MNNYAVQNVFLKKIHGGYSGAQKGLLKIQEMSSGAQKGFSEIQGRSSELPEGSSKMQGRSSIVQKSYPNNQKPYDLHKLFVKLGRQRHKLRNRLLAILPQIYESGIWKKYAGTIEEYAGKYGDIGNSTVKKRLRLEENLVGKPHLKAAIKEVGIHKVALVAKLATPETDAAYADKVIHMSKSAVQTLSKELRWKEERKRALLKVGEDERKRILLAAGEESGCIGGQRDLFVAVGEAGGILSVANSLDVEKSISDEKKDDSNLCCAVPKTIKIELDAEMTFLFLKLKKKLGKHLGNQQALKMILEEVERGVELLNQLKKKTCKNTGTKVQGAGGKMENVVKADNSIGQRQIWKTKSVTGDTFSQKPSRYIPKNQKREANHSTNGQCTYPGCNLPADNLHHTIRFYENKSHASIIPLCGDHHAFAHNGVIQNEKQKHDFWRLHIKNVPSAAADILYRRYRYKAMGCRL